MNALSTRRQFITTAAAIAASTTAIGSEPDPPRDYRISCGGCGNGDRKSMTLQQVIDGELEEIQFAIREGHDMARYPDSSVFCDEKIVAVLQYQPNGSLKVVRFNGPG